MEESNKEDNKEYVEDNYPTPIKSFLLFTNVSKKKPNHPDFNGILTDEKGKQWHLTGWKKQARNNSMYISGVVQSMEEWRKRTKINYKQGKTPRSYVKDDNVPDLPFS